MGRRIGGVVVGILAAGLVVMLVEGVGQSAFPPPAGFDPSAPDLSLVPLPALVSVALAWVLGPLAGGLVATLVGRPPGPLPTPILGAFFLGEITRFGFRQVVQFLRTRDQRGAFLLQLS